MSRTEHAHTDASGGGAVALAEHRDMEVSLDSLLWRSAVARGPKVPDISDQLRLARLCQAGGLASSARMLHQIIRLQRGFPGGSPARQPDVTTPETGPDVWHSPSSVTDVGRGTVERAIHELHAFAGSDAIRFAADFATRTDDKTSAASPYQHGAGISDGSLPGIIEDVYAFLSEEISFDIAREQNDTFTRIRRLNAGVDDFDHRSFANAPLPLMAAAAAFSGLQDYCFANDDFMFGRFGSPALLHAVARFEDAGLGSYFSNLPRLVRKSQDIFELAQIAHAAGHAAGAVMTREEWVVLLSVRLSGGLRDEVVDDLGDIGAMVALAAILDRTLRQPRHRSDPALIMRVRDAALDNADYDLGVRAQGALVRLFPDQLLERRLLGEIHASGGLTRTAEQILSECLAKSPGDPVIVERLEALHAGNYEPYRIRHGFGTPPDRLRGRLLRRERAAL